MRIAASIPIRDDGNWADAVKFAVEAEQIGISSIWSREAWGFDAVTPLAFLGGKTTPIGLGTGVMQIGWRAHLCECDNDRYDAKFNVQRPFATRTGNQRSTSYGRLARSVFPISFETYPRAYRDRSYSDKWPNAVLRRRIPLNTHPR